MEATVVPPPPQCPTSWVGGSLSVPCILLPNRSWEQEQVCSFHRRSLEALWRWWKGQAPWWTSSYLPPAPESPAMSACVGASPGSLPSHSASPSCLHSMLTFNLSRSSDIAGTCTQLLSKCRAANYKLYFDVLLFGNNYPVPKMLAYLLLVQKDDNTINVAQFPKVHQSLLQC